MVQRNVTQLIKLWWRCCHTFELWLYWNGIIQAPSHVNWVFHIEAKFDQIQTCMASRCSGNEDILVLKIDFFFFFLNMKIDVWGRWRGISSFWAIDCVSEVSGVFLTLVGQTTILFKLYLFISLFLFYLNVGWLPQPSPYNMYHRHEVIYVLRCWKELILNPR